MNGWMTEIYVIFVLESDYCNRSLVVVELTSFRFISSSSLVDNSFESSLGNFPLVDWLGSQHCNDVKIRY